MLFSENPSRASLARRAKARAFTLIELLVVMTIVVVMASLTMAGLTAVRKKADMMQDVSAGRTLISAYLNAASDNNGEFMFSKDDQAVVQTGDGVTIGYPVAGRYPYRLAPYFLNQIHGTLINTANEKSVKTNGVETEYNISAYPAFGINQYFLGGERPLVGKMKLEGEYASSQSQLTSPIVAFATSSSSTEGRGTHGFFYVVPPRVYSPMWPTDEWTSTGNPSRYGNVHPRHGERAIVAMTDGTVRPYTIEELRDMRLWNKNAVAEDNANYQVAR